MSELKSLLSEAKSSLQELESLLQRARSLDKAADQERSLSREEIQGYFAEILKIIERIPENLHLEESQQRKDQIQQLHQEMEAVRHRVEESIALLEVACERNVAQLAEFVEGLQKRFSSISQEGQETPSMPQLNELLSQGKAHIESKDYEACLKLMNEALNVAPENPDVTSCMQEAQRKLEDQRLEEELVIHIENLKKEAMHLFDQERYKDCAGMFKFLCELEPKNRTLQDYLELSQQKVQELEDASDREPQRASQSPASIEAACAGETSRGVSSDSREEGPANATSNSAFSLVPAELASSTRSECEDHSHADLWNPSQSHPETLLAQSSAEPVLEDGEAMAEVEPVGSKKSLFAAFAVVAVLVGVFLGVVLLRGSKPLRGGGLEIHSEPPGARVVVNGELRGETPLRLESLAAGSHQVRLEKDGFAPVVQGFVIERGKPASLSVRLQELAAEPVPIDQLEEEAGELLGRGQWLEASQRCDMILSRDRENPTAVALKDKIRSLYWQQSQAAKQRGKLDEARVALENLLKAVPADATALRELTALKSKPKPERDTTRPEHAGLRNQTEELYRQIGDAMKSGNYFPPAAGNALELVQHLGVLSPADPIFKERMDQLHRESISQLQRRIQSKDWEGAKNLARLFQSYFPASAELKNMRDSLNADEARQLEARNSLLQKIELAMGQGNYVTPVNENALAYCNRLLGLDGQNARIRALRREALTRAAAQARDLTAKEKFDQARDVLSALLIAAQSEAQPGLAQELRSQLDRLEFAVYPVVHDHTLGSCSGRLRMNAYVIAFVPSGETKDGFSQKLSGVIEAEAGDKLKVQLRNKTYRFQANLTKNKEENRRKVEEMYQKLASLKKLTKPE